MTAWAPTVLPSSNSIVRAVPLSLACSLTALRVVMTSAPNRSACRRADVVSSAPETPVGEAEVVLDPRASAGLPAGCGLLDQHGLQALRRAVHRGGKAGGPAADDREFVHLQRRAGGQAQHRGQFGVGRLDQRLALLGDHHRQLAAVQARGVEQLLALRLVGHERAERMLVARQELAHLPRPLVPPVPDDLGVGNGAVTGGVPGLEQPVDHRVQLLLGRIPRLEQVVVEVDDVDRVDRGVGVGVGRQQHPAGERVDVHRLFEELDAAHLRHPVVGDEHRDGVAAQLELVAAFPVRPGRIRRARSGISRRSGGEGRGRRRGTPRGRRRRSELRVFGAGAWVQSSITSMRPLSSGYVGRRCAALAWRFSDFGAGRRAGSIDQRCGIRAGSCVPLFRNFWLLAHVL